MVRQTHYILIPLNSNLSKFEYIKELKTIVENMTLNSNLSKFESYIPQRLIYQALSLNSNLSKFECPSFYAHEKAHHSFKFQSV